VPADESAVGQDEAVQALDPDTEANLRRARLTYPEVGQTRYALPSGYASISEHVTLSSTDLSALASSLLRWVMHERAGLRVAASSAVVGLDEVAVLRFGSGPFSVKAPCRIVYVIDEPRRRGFAYGTLPGHPESGEESFILSSGDDGRVSLTITAFSRPATALARLAGPVGRRAQRAITHRYLRSLDRS
jgi:uncharacterized protein (UPF0548 family)